MVNVNISKKYLNKASLGLEQDQITLSMMLVAIKHNFFLRTVSRELPSEKTVKQVITPIVIFNLMALPSNGIIREIQPRFLSIKNTLRKQADDQHSIDQAA